MPGPADARQALDIEVDQVARMLVFVANYGRGRVKRAEPIHSGATQDSAYGGSTEFEFVGDAPAVPTLPAKNQNPF